MENRCYKIYPGLSFGHTVWYIEYEDGTEETLPFDTIDIAKKLIIKEHKYLTKKRKEKINKILGGK